MQQNLFEADLTWFHLFRGMIQQGQIKKLGASTFAVYCVVKSHSNFQTGDSFISIKTISELTGLGKRSVLNCLAKLRLDNLITSKKIGRLNHYRIQENLPVLHSGNEIGTFSFNYAPMGMADIKNELEQFLRHGIPANSKITINIHQNHAEVIHIQHVNN